MLRFIESLNFIHVRRAHESAVQTVCPGVIRTSNRLAQLSRFVLAQSRAAMAADIVECAHFAVLIAQNDETFAPCLLRQIGACAGDLTLMPDHEPLIGKNPLLFFRKNLR